MKIGLIGPAGSGKTQVAKALAKELTLDIIDGYIKSFQLETNLAVGGFGSYIVNLQIAIERLNRELYQKKINNEDYVTCGTIVDTSLYLAFNAAEFHDNGDGTFDAKLLDDMRTFSTMYLLALIKTDTWAYDKVFYLHPPTDTEDTLAQIFHHNAKEAISTFQIPEYTELSGTIEERIEQALEAVRVSAT